LPKNDNKFFKSNRLLSKNDFQGLRTGSRFFASGLFVFYFKRNKNSKTRLGIAITKKFGKANIRNKMKRKIREHFRKSEFKETGYDLLVSINFKKLKKDKLSLDSTFKLVDSSLEDCFQSKLR
jgi:ribonuclease P protein component